MHILAGLVHAVVGLHERVGRFLEPLSLISVAQFHVRVAFQLRVLVRVGWVPIVLRYRVRLFPWLQYDTTHSGDPFLVAILPIDIHPNQPFSYPRSVRWQLMRLLYYICSGNDDRFFVLI